MMLWAFFILAALHFGGIITLPLWLVFAPLIIWITVVVVMGITIAWATLNNK